MPSILSVMESCVNLRFSMLQNHSVGDGAPKDVFGKPPIESVMATVENFYSAGEPCTSRRRRARGSCSFAYSVLASFLASFRMGYRDRCPSRGRRKAHCGRFMRRSRLA
jgi:hypothetical protein